MSPASADAISSRSSECMRNMRGTRTLRISLLVLKIVSPAETVPW